MSYGGVSYEGRTFKAAQKDGGLSRDAAIEEVVADACEMVMGNSKAIERLAKEKPGLAKRIADWLHEFFSDIRKAFEGVEARHEEAKAMLDYMDELTKLWDDALVEAAENRQKVKNTETKNSQRDYSYEALISKPDMKLTVVDSNVPNNRVDVIAQAKKNASVFSRLGENENPLVFVNDINTEVMLSTKGLRHGLDRRFGINAPVTLKAGEILKNAIKINELTPDKHTIDSTYVLIGAAKNENNELYIVQFVVNRATNEVTSIDVLYSINAKTTPEEVIKKESTGSLSPEITDESATLTDSTISISNLLDYVNKYFPDILPEDVLKHYGYDSRPEGKLGESALFSRRDSAEGLTKEEARAQAAAYTRLKAENAELQRRVEYWKGQTQRTKQATVRQTDVNRFSRQLIKRYGSTADQLVMMGDIFDRLSVESIHYGQSGLFRSLSQVFDNVLRILNALGENDPQKTDELIVSVMAGFQPTWTARAANPRLTSFSGLTSFAISFKRNYTNIVLMWVIIARVFLSVNRCFRFFYLQI